MCARRATLVLKSAISADVINGAGQNMSLTTATRIFTQASAS